MLQTVSLQGCIETFFPSIDEKQVMLVVYGLLTDQDGYCRVRISRSGTYNDPKFTPEPECQELQMGTGGNLGGSPCQPVLEPAGETKPVRRETL